MPQNLKLLDSYSKKTMQFEGKEKTVYQKGKGPGVIVIHEIPGITPKVIAFADRVAALGCTVWMPSLFGVDTQKPSSSYVVGGLVKACISAEFVCLASNKSSPVTLWLRALAKDLHQEAGGPGVGVVGMCLTGGFALAMMVDSTIVAPVLSQPSTPFPFGRNQKKNLGVSEEDLVVIQKRVREGCPVLGLRFTNDATMPGERFETLKQKLGEGFIAVEIDSAPGNAHGIPRGAHSVLTEHLVDEPGHPTQDALHQVLGFLEKQLAL